MTFEESLKNLKYLISDDCTDTHFDYIEEIETEIEALEKQIPKKPKYEDVDNIYGAIKRTCTACGDVCMVSNGAKPYEHYCRHCGQALDWRADND